MQITVNYEKVTLEENATLADLMATRTVPTGCGGTAVAVNDELVTRAQWEACTLHEGDKVLVISAAYGG